MAKYSDIKGFTVQTLSTDTVASQAAGGSWASGGDLNTARSYIVGVGISTAALAAGGYTGSYTGKTESYNGTAWTETTDLNTTRAIGAGAGTYTAAIYFGGAIDPTTYDNTESWNGSTWTEVNDLNEVKTSMMSGGTSTAAICAGGSPNRVSTEIWDGTNWTEVNNIPSVLLATTGGGSATSAIIATGQTNPPDSGMQSTADSWDGTNWSEISPVNTARYQAGGTGFQPGSSNTDVMIFGGGTTPVTGKTEFWNGSSWTEIGDMSTARGQQAASDGTSSDAIVAGGNTGSYSAATEEWTAPSTFTKQVEGQLFFNSTVNAFKETVQDFPGGTFASGGSLNTARRQQGTFGAHNDAIVAGTLTYGANVENYNGTTWTEINDVPAGASSSGGSGTTSSSGAVFMGYNTSTSVTNATYEFDGTNWTAGGSANTSRGAGGGTGSSADDAIYVGGTNAAAPQTIYANVETYNGSSWTETTDIGTASQLMALVGTSTSALLIGGSPAPTPTQTQSWNGTSWTNIGALPTNIYGNAGFGTSALAIAFGGLPPGTDTNANMRAAMFYNGTSWSDVAEMATSRASANGAGTNTSATNGLAFGGYNPLNAPGFDDDANKTEEWTVDLGNKTITTS